MEQNCLAGTQKSGLRRRTLYRVAAVGIATLITQASPGGAASSWGVECLTTNSDNNSYCVTSLSDDIPSDSAAWTLRKSVEAANTRAAASATIGFQVALFSASTSSDNAKLVLNSTLEIKTNLTITAPTDSEGSPLLTIVRGDSVASGAPLISINPTADAHPATLTTGPAANQATEEVRIENVNIQARANTENPQGSGFAGQQRESAHPGVTIQVKETIPVTSTGPDVVAPTVVLVNTTISNAVSESGGAAINTPGNVRVEGSTLVGNVAITPSGGAPTDGGAIKAGGTVTVVSSALNNNSATGDGGAISASSVSVSTAQDSSLSQLNGNTAGGSGGAISAEGTVSVSESTLTGNTATTGSGGAISTSGATSTVEVDNSGLVNNTAGGSGGAISATGVSSTVAVTNSGLGNNTAGGNGGAISTSGTSGAVSVANSSLGLNTASGNGGAIAAGGAVNVSSSSVLVSNSATSGNGGAIMAGGDVTITNSGLAGNTASGDGGAISATGATSAVEVTNSGLATNTAGGSGGAISVTGATSAVEVTNSVLAFNTASTGNGGSVSTTGSTSTVSITNSGLGYNTAGGDGGAIAASGANSTVLIKDTSIAENIAGKDGGGVSSGGQVTIGSNSSTPINAPTTGSIDSAVYATTTSEASDSTFSGSTSTSLTLGSNVYSTSAGQGSSGSSDSATNPSGSIMFKNTAASGNGGAISATGAVTVISGSNIYANTAKDNGGAISAGGQVEVSTSTLNGNTATEGDGGAISAGGQVTVSASNLNFNDALEGHGGAIFSGDKVVTSSTTFFVENSAAVGGAIAATTSVDISRTEFIDNWASAFGGAILLNPQSDEKSTISNSTFEGNYGGSAGGAILGNEAKLVISNTDFLYNSADVAGGAIAHGGDLEVIGSTFTGNIASADEAGIQEVRNWCEEEDGLDRGFCILFSGKFDPIVDIEDIEIDSLYGFASGGAIRVFSQLPQQTVSILDSDFSQNSAQGDGGAIFFLGLLQILGSRFEENWSLLALFFSDSDSNPISEVRGSGGAIYGEKIEITNSTFDANFAGINGGAIFTEGSLEILDTEFENNFACGDNFCDGYGGDGGGGAIAAAGSVSVADSLFKNNSTVTNGGAINLIDGDLSIKDSTFDGNLAYEKGGAIYSLGDLNVGGSTFGSAIPVLNPSYNPERPRRNPDYIPGDYVSSTMLNPMCEGQPYYGYEDDFCEIGDASYPWSISNPEYEPEYFYDLDDETKDPDNDKYNYDGNSSGDDGGAIYVEGITTINNSSFAGNTSDENGGAIYSNGTLQINDSSFNRNWAEEDGGAIDTTPDDGDLFITRTSFIENISLDDGGAIYISTGSVEHYDDVILSSLFRGNEAFETGGAITSGYVVLILNTFEDNKSLEGQSLNVSGGYLSGNVLIGPAGGQDLCFIDSFSRASNNFATDVSCFGVLNHEGLNNDLLIWEKITEEGALHTLPEGYETTLQAELKDNEEFFLEFPSEGNLDGLLAPLGTFITGELNKDFKSEIRDSTVLWTAGHLQGIFPDLINEPEVDNTEGETETVMPKDQEQNSQEQNSGSNNQGVVNQPDSTNPDSPVLIFEPTLTAEELARISQLRAEQLAAERLRQKEVERIAAENLAKKKAAKLARDKARALAAEKRRAQLAALKAKIAATHARGVALKQKPSWINLMKNSSIPNAAKGLVRVPTK